MIESVSPKLRWLHRIGYICTALIVVEVVWLSVMAGAAWWKSQEYRADRRSESRVYNGTLLENKSVNNATSGAITRLGALPSISALGSNSVRVGVDPALQDITYALAMLRRDGVAEGIVVVFNPQDDWTEKRTTFRFQAPPAEFDQVMQQFDAITQQYEGGDRSCTDGVSYAFERRNGPVTKSGTSATGCDKTYEEAARLLLTFARQFAPLPKSLS